MQEETKLEPWEEDAWKMLKEADEATVKNLKENEALFDCGAYYTIPKDELEEVVAIVSNDPETNLITVLWSDYDEELIESYIENMGDNTPYGTFIITFWGKDTQTSIEYDEWDFSTSKNYKLEMFSDFNFEKALKQIPRVIESNKNLLQKINALQGYLEKQNTAGAYECMHEIKKHLYKEIDEIR